MAARAAASRKPAAPPKKAVPAAPRPPYVHGLKTCGHVCMLATKRCCECLDARPHADGYEKYVDTVGMTMTGARHDGYCPTCKSRIDDAIALRGVAATGGARCCAPSAAAGAAAAACSPSGVLDARAKARTLVGGTAAAPSATRESGSARRLACPACGCVLHAAADHCDDCGRPLLGRSFWAAVGGASASKVPASLPPRRGVLVVARACGHACELTTRSCCECMDRRPHTARYPRYVDGVGVELVGARHDGYCTACKDRLTGKDSGRVRLVASRAASGTAGGAGAHVSAHRVAAPPARCIVASAADVPAATVFITPSAAAAAVGAVPAIPAATSLVAVAPPLPPGAAACAAAAPAAALALVASTPAAAAAAATAATATCASLDSLSISALHTELEKLRLERQCAVCLDAPKGVAFGCGHMTCAGCAPLLSKCHICRTTVTSRMTLFF